MSTLRPDTVRLDSVRLDSVRLDRWVARAACRGSDTGLFFPDRYSRESAGAAKAVCARCPVLRPCRAWAMAHPGERGIWGGLTEAERRAARRRGHEGRAA